LLQSGQLTEGVVTLAALAQSTGLALINSVRGWVDVELTLPPQTTQS
jgi:branched-subunit amino acid aminotransferase/4-amino-4-deoxychorismate lyase